MNDFEKSICLKLTTQMLEMELCKPFREKVDPIRDGAGNYEEIISEPMYLSLIKSKLHNNEYKSTKSWRDDVNLIWKNAKLFNGENTLLYLVATEMETWFRKKIAKFPKTKEDQWLLNLNKCSKLLHILTSKAPKATLNQPSLPPKKTQEPSEAQNLSIKLQLSSSHPDIIPRAKTAPLLISDPNEFRNSLKAKNEETISQPH